MMSFFLDGRCISAPIRTRGREVCGDPGSLHDESKEGI